MIRPIKIGDLVMFTRSCCDRFRDSVAVFVVASIRPTRTSSWCSGCRRELPNEPYAADAPQYPGAPVSWLKRIPPLGELESEKTKEPIHEPA